MCKIGISWRALVFPWISHASHLNDVGWCDCRSTYHTIVYIYSWYRQCVNGQCRGLHNKETKHKIDQLGVHNLSIKVNTRKLLLVKYIYSPVTLASDFSQQTWCNSHAAKRHSFWRYSSVCCEWDYDRATKKRLRTRTHQTIYHLRTTKAEITLPTTENEAM